MLRIFFRFTLKMLLVSLCCTKAKAQYFYKDIWNAGQLNKEISVLKAGRIKTISIKSFDSDGEPSQGFFCEKRIDRNYDRIQMMSRSNVTGESLILSYFNPAGLIIRTVDSTSNSFSRTDYEYDENGKFTTIKTFTKDDEEAGGISETHRYIYTGGALTRMVREKNNIPVSTINFNVDDKGNIIDEEEILKAGKGKKYFYYYDDKNQLTDVVHYNERAKRLLPDYMYEYDQLGQIIKLITTEEGGNNYFIWRYTYENGLRIREKCFSKEKRLMGTIEYVYN